MKKEVSKAGTGPNTANNAKVNSTPGGGGGGGGTGNITPTGTSTPPSVGSVGGAHTPGPIKPGSDRNTPTLDTNPASNASNASGNATPTQPKLEAPDTPLGVNGDASNPASNAQATPPQENNGAESIGAPNSVNSEDIKPPLGLNSGANTPSSSASATPNHNSNSNMGGAGGAGNNSGSGAPQGGADADFLDQFDSKDGGEWSYKHINQFNLGFTFKRRKSPRRI